MLYDQIQAFDFRRGGALAAPIRGFCVMCRTSLKSWNSLNLMKSIFAIALLAISCASLGDIRALMGPYPLETHQVSTDDKYIITIHRIPSGSASSSSRKASEILPRPHIKPIDKKNGPLPLPLPLPKLSKLPKPQLGRKMLGGTSSRPPVLLIHGISLSSTCWVINGPDQSLGFILADAGYDVWMHNTRGNTFSRGHKTMQDTDSAYWDFSMDEMALHDLPSVIDYILKSTGVSSLPIITHSQGSTLLFMLLSSPAHAHYTSKVQIHIAMAPVAYVKLMTSPMMASFCAAGNIKALHELPPSEYFIMSPTLQSLVLNGACQASLMLPICLGVVEGLFGHSRHISPQDYQRLFLNWPSSTSFKDVLHWAQMWNQDQPRLTKFKSNEEYDLQRIETKTVILSGSVDVLAPPSNIVMIKNNIGGAVDEMSKTVDSYGHMEWIWDSKAKDLAYPTILKSLSKFSTF